MLMMSKSTVCTLLASVLLVGEPKLASRIVDQLAFGVLALGRPGPGHTDLRRIRRRSGGPR